MSTIYEIASINNEEIDPRTGKPIIRVIFPDNVEVRMTMNVAVGIGKIAEGTQRRYEAHMRARHGGECNGH